MIPIRKTPLTLILLIIFSFLSAQFIPNSTPPPILSTPLDVEIGTTTPETKEPNVGGLRMDAMGNIEVRGEMKSTKLTINTKWWPDFVFDKSYKLKPLSEVETFIKTNGHLPNIPSEKEILKTGVDIGTMQAKQLQKIEELTLYTIQQEKKIEELNKKLELILQKMNK